MFACNIDRDTELRLLENLHAEALFPLIEKNRYHLRPWMGWLEERTTLEVTRQFISCGLRKFADNK